MQSKLNNAPDTQIRGKPHMILGRTCLTLPPELHREDIPLSEAESAIRKVIRDLLENTPHRLLNTLTGVLYDREAQINAFTTSTEYQELLLLEMKHANLERMEEAAETYFHYVMLSHRWQEDESPLYDIHGKKVYDMYFESRSGTTKLHPFCRVAHDAGYRWAWVDICCIDQTSNVEVQESVNSMFAWYRDAALTIVYLSDVPPSSKSGALARSAWNQRGWTVQEFLASKVVLFYQMDWTLYLDNRSNHKESAAIMRELEDATGIDVRSLVSFRPGMRGARKKLQWVSMRDTTVPEDIAYSLFGIFGVKLPVIYGERKQNALGRLLQEVVAQSGDITALDWVGKSSEFHSCLPAEIASYGAPSCSPPFPSGDEIQTSASLLRSAVGVELALKLHNTLDQVSVARFAARRLRLPCIIFPVTEVKWTNDQGQQPLLAFMIKADGLQDLSITTEDNLNQLWRAGRARHTFLLVRPWDRSLLYPPDVADFPYLSNQESESPGENKDSKSYSRALRLIVRLGQPFSAFFLMQQRGGEYKRIASDQNIIAQVKDMTSVNDMMDIRTLEIS
jgi:hypothetical protein